MTDTPNTTQGKGAVDWSAMIEAVHSDGRIVPVNLVSTWRGYEIRPILEDEQGAVAIFNRDGTHSWKGKRGRPNIGWRIRNVPEHPTPTQYAPELVERMVALCRRAADTSASEDLHGSAWCWVAREADLIISDLPQEEDPDDQAASDLVIKLSRDGFIFGNTDQAESVAMAGIKLGRQLQRGEAA